MSDKLLAAFGCCDCVVVNEAGHIKARLQWTPEQSSEDRMSLAKLMAAAPELAEALEACAEYLEGPGSSPADGWGCLDRGADADRREALAKARAALEKAGLR